MIRQLISFLQQHPDQIAVFAKKIGVDEETIANTISEEGQFSFVSLKLIASKLKVSLTQLLSESNESINFQFRSSVENVNQLIINEKVNLLVNNFHPLLLKYGKPSHIPDKQFYQFPEDPEFAANVVRNALLEHNYARPLVDLAILIANKLNVIIIIKDIGADGASAFIDGYAYIIISPRFAPRMLFTLAHELGHLILQHHQNSMQIDYERINVLRKTYNNKFEVFANDFGSNLLMPKSLFAKVLLEIKEGNNIPRNSIGDVEIISLAYYFGVSFEAAAMRCEQLGLLPSGSARSIYDIIKKDFKSPERRAQEIGLERNLFLLLPITASPNLLSPLFGAIENGEISASKVANLLGIDLNQLLGLHSQLGNELYN